MLQKYTNAETIDVSKPAMSVLTRESQGGKGESQAMVACVVVRRVENAAEGDAAATHYERVMKRLSSAMVYKCCLRGSGH